MDNSILREKRQRVNFRMPITIYNWLKAQAYKSGISANGLNTRILINYWQNTIRDENPVSRLFKNE